MVRSLLQLCNKVSCKIIAKNRRWLHVRTTFGGYLGKVVASDRDDCLTWIEKYGAENQYHLQRSAIGCITSYMRTASDTELFAPPSLPYLSSVEG